MKKTGIFVIFFISSMFFTNLIFSGLCSGRQDRSEEVNSFINKLDSSSIKERTDAAKRIVRSGLSDPKLFNIINARLLNIDSSRLSNTDYLDELSWYCKALASSGRSEYKETLDTVARSGNHDKLQHYASESLGLIEYYAKRNSVMADTSNAPFGQSPEVTRSINMLKSGDNRLIKDTAKDMYRSPSSMDPVLFKVANEVLLNSYQNSDDVDHIDTMSWLCKALGASGNSEYKATLEKVISTTSSPTLAKHAKTSLDMLK